jgi:hypothetical protein
MLGIKAFGTMVGVAAALYLCAAMLADEILCVFFEFRIRHI